MKKILAAFAANTVFANIVLIMIFMGGALVITSYSIHYTKLYDLN